MKHKVLWMKAAQIDLQSVFDYIKTDSEQHAIKNYHSIKSATKKLEDFPNAGRIVPELENQNLLGIRELVIGHWRILYKVLDTKVHIVGVLDSRRNIPDILNNRFLKST
jgi:addiction module RelE/StbE family toxin